jgi:hypothetical protein
MRRAALLIALAALAGCTPPARSTSYFKAHPEETGKVLVDCVAGSHRGPDCDNAKAAEAMIDSDRRLALYKHSF